MSFLKLLARCAAIPPQRTQGEHFNEGDNSVLAVLCGNVVDVHIAKEAWDSKFLSYFKQGSKHGLTSSLRPSYHTDSDQIGSRYKWWQSILHISSYGCCEGSYTKY